MTAKNALEAQPQTELREALLALAGVAGEDRRRIGAGSGQVAGPLARVPHEARAVLGVEEVEDLADQLDTVARAESELLREADVQLREVVAARRVDVRDARLQHVRVA